MLKFNIELSLLDLPEKVVLGLLTLESVKTYESFADPTTHRVSLNELLASLEKRYEEILAKNRHDKRIRHIEYAINWLATEFYEIDTLEFPSNVFTPITQ